GFWLVNRERIDRGVMAMHGVEPNVIEVAQAYAQYLLDNDVFGHNENGTPTQRLDANPTIGACRESLGVVENLAVFATTESSIPLPVEQSVYNWMYKDAGAGWGHRHAILWYPYNDNSGPSGMEGFLGIGRAAGGPYQGPFPETWPFAELIVMNVFDPCSSWDYSADEIFSDGFESGDTSAWSSASP
ncbi:MAG: CAP domain-containing protein, partial [bacterium]|nr:CAP domain-containing protein [bacterium]